MKLNLILCSIIMAMSTIFTACSNLQTKAFSTIQNPQKQLHSKQPIIAYFSKESQLQDSTYFSNTDHKYSPIAVKNGYYRLLLGRDQAGNFLVQDFYQSNQKPQSSPLSIKDPLGLFSFENIYVKGPITLYYPDGKISYEATLDNGQEIGKSKSYYKNAKIAAESESIKGEIVSQTLWYSTGLKAFESILVINDPSKTMQTKVWNKQGLLIEDLEQKAETIDLIFKEVNTLLE